MGNIQCTCTCTLRQDEALHSFVLLVAGLQSDQQLINCKGWPVLLWWPKVIFQKLGNLVQWCKQREGGFGGSSPPPLSLAIVGVATVNISLFAVST